VEKKEEVDGMPAMFLEAYAAAAAKKGHEGQSPCLMSPVPDPHALREQSHAQIQHASHPSCQSV
jgi:hypothetical protein